ncbi:MAG: hypothetical protein OCU12_02785 [Methanophagales archaeon]|nr:hypothetical protein [Methanophagales archaeon]
MKASSKATATLTFLLLGLSARKTLEPAGCVRKGDADLATSRNASKFTFCSTVFFIRSKTLLKSLHRSLHSVAVVKPRCRIEIPKSLLRGILPSTFTPQYFSTAFAAFSPCRSLPIRFRITPEI